MYGWTVNGASSCWRRQGQKRKKNMHLWVEPPGQCLLQLQIHENTKITTHHMTGGCGGSEPLRESATIYPILNVFYTLALRDYGSRGTWREEWVGTAADGESLTKHITQIF